MFVFLYLSVFWTVVIVIVIVIVTTNRSLHRLPTMGPTIGSVTVVPSQSLCDLGVNIDADLTMRTQVQRIASRGLAVLRRLRNIRR